MNKIYLTCLLFIASIHSYAQTPLSLNLICQINGEITSMSLNGVDTVPIKDLAMSVLVERGALSISDGSNYFTNKLPAQIEENRILGTALWTPKTGEDRSQYIEINRNTGMVQVVKTINYSNPTIILKASASGNCEKLANKKKF